MVRSKFAVFRGGQLIGITLGFKYSNNVPALQATIFSMTNSTYEWLKDAVHLQK